MLRFDRHSDSRRRRQTGGERRGIWMLLLMLGAVLLLMQQLRRPEAAEHLGRIFSVPPSVAKMLPDDPSEPSKAVAPAVDVSRPPWSAVEDNAPFSMRERDAWFQLFRRVQSEASEELSERSLGVATVAQLVSQSRTYRGQVVRVQGQVVRESLKPAPQNELGIGEYHQLVLAPAAGDGRPAILYALELPPDFPRGDGIAADATVDALFFKTWLYTDGDQMSLAPVLVTRTLSWTPPRRTELASPSPAARRGGLAEGIIIAVALAAIFITLVIGTTRRRRPSRVPAAVDFTLLENEA